MSYLSTLRSRRLLERIAFFVGGYAVLAERALEFVHADVLLGHVDSMTSRHARGDWAVPRCISKTTVATGKLGDQIIKDQQSRARRATGERGSGAVMAFCTAFEISRSSVRSKGSSGRLHLAVMRSTSTRGR